ncbi:endolytic transglycosylase MltG [candidate division WWE3 bacterium]|jgi:UPF0755 protein|uniref:Endolytic murein transglycosylase n=1 Tax=candidate division WWE3 bacterium TaxID=2053526 RepID=A0A3A4ZJD1_UNCKA|nr:MAG: endolytic transglycosylase MltG [candidate division WWE3 bacterium]
MSEPLDPQKFHIFTTEKKISAAIIIGLILLIILPPLAFTYYRFSIGRPSQTSDEVTFEIKNGQPISETASLLYSEGAINSEFLFTLYVFLNNYDKNIQAGTYRIPAGISIVDLVEMFQHGVNDISITFLEGWRVEEIAREASRKLDKIDYTDFVTRAKNLEGYLFPDTYLVNKDITEEELVKLLNDTFYNKTSELLNEERVKSTGLTPDEIVKFASIVEREVFKLEDRRIVAGILIKRYKEGMKIDADATTQYVAAAYDVCGSMPSPDCIPTVEDYYELEWWPKELTFEDLEIDSPYNTRKVVGLPPTPISNPGLDAISSVLEYEDTVYYYYLNDKFGNTYFAVNLDEHNANISRYLSN